MTLRERIERYIVTNGGNPKNVHDAMNFFMDAFIIKFCSRTKFS